MKEDLIFNQLNNYICRTNHDLDPIEIYNNFLIDNKIVVSNPNITIIMLEQIVALITIDRQLFLELL